MPLNAYALVGTFGLISILAGAVAVRLVGPRHPAAAVCPSLAAFGLLYVAGHRFGWSIGPTIPLYGFEVALPFEVGLALAAALAVAGLQRGALGLALAGRRTGTPSTEG